LTAALGCVSSARRAAGTGDIAFRLLWQGPVDLDLHVTSPLDETIDFVRRTSESGGRLDVDCNAAPDRMCPRPIENVFWPAGKAPPGTYEVWVELANLPGRKEEAERFVEVGVELRLQILRGTEVVDERTGRLIERGEVFGPLHIPYTPGTRTAAR
jgi:uncharacterized protein YfaP (DUF2135 family)